MAVAFFLNSALAARLFRDKNSSISARLKKSLWPLGLKLFNMPVSASQ
jgi:hypothetical protein